MPTGYTSKLYEGRQTLQEFVSNAARAFGYLMPLRETGFTGKLPESMEEIHSLERAALKDKIAKAREELAAAYKLTTKEALETLRKNRTRHNRERKEAAEEFLKRQKRFKEMYAKIEKMKKTNATSEFRDFMLRQLAMDIEERGSPTWNYYCAKGDPAPTLADAEMYVIMHRKRAADDLARYETDLKRLEHHIKEGNAWLAEIRKFIEEQS